MRLRLSRFDGLRLSLSRNWYVVPSHVPVAEVRRLTDILRSGVDGIRHVIELDWTEWDEVSRGLNATTLVHIEVTTAHSPAEIEALVSKQNVRIGLIHAPHGRHWPDHAWDELEVKSALVGWLRRQFASQAHPLAVLGISDLPLGLIASVTAEPVEILELVEATVICKDELDATPAERWSKRASASIAQRLATRLRTSDHRANEAMAGLLLEGLLSPAELAGVLLGTESGHLRASLHREASVELERKGLATRAGDDVMFGPLARSLRIPQVREEFIRRFFPTYVDYR